MRKAQKQEILKAIGKLQKLHAEIKKYMEAQQYIAATDLLIQCQESAISVGTVIEKSEGEDFITVFSVQEYCDYLYYVYEQLVSNARTINCNKIYKNLNKRLLKIENSINHDITIRKEIVFFPYKASMWDALESAYFAAKQEPIFDVYCVPIPYYEKNSDGSLGQMHYEGNEYPKNIDIVDWQEYNYEERNPDVVYIHNAYDSWNLVTCVHPRFFSKKLKAHTDELVYIPYFILKEIEPDNQIEIDEMKHFCFLPGIINADKVIIQSEKMKQIYVNEYLKAAKKNGLQGAHIDKKELEKKFLGVGSPKIDKVKNTKKENIEIPNGWLTIIEKPDKSWKKIVFYNTSIAALLENDEKMLEKMRYVFRVLKEHKGEIALLWRPHPLIQNTISSMRPSLWKEYEQIVNQYKEEGWGIYDDTSDVERAVILSDIYYGDHSSVVQLCQAVEKKVIIQDVNAKEFNKYQLLAAHGCAVKEDKIFIPSFNVNMLIEFEMTGEDVKIHQLDSGNSTVFKYLYTDIIFDGDIAYLAPTNSEKFAIFYSVTGKIDYISFDINIRKLLRFYWDTSFIVPLFCKRYLFYIGIGQTSAIARYDLEKREFCYFSNEFVQIYGDKYRLYSGGGAVVDDTLLIPLYNQCKILAMNVITGKSTIISLDGQVNENLRTIDKVGACLYFSTNKGTIFLWDYEEERVIQIVKEGSGREFIKSFVAWDRIYYYPLDYVEYPVSYVSRITNEYGELGKLPGYLCSATYDSIRDKIVLNTELGIYMQDRDGMIEPQNCKICDNQICEFRSKFQKGVCVQNTFTEGNPIFMSLDYFLTII